MVLTIQRRAVSVIWEYSVMVERTLNIRQVRTDKKLRIKYLRNLNSTDCYSHSHVIHKTFPACGML